ncbi:hypothetical protein Dvar_04060 [Desulfosarcina variabilis str. Montpellier]|uniref:hypothetical protein n=1 Tax=Desulfosarcina variabilis TaxID=2300 RepID=UPI003AFB24CA
MKNTDSPDLTDLMHHLGACPFEFQMMPRMGETGEIDTAALCRDALRMVGHEPLSGAAEKQVHFTLPPNPDHLLAAQIGCWFFSHAWFRGRKNLIPKIVYFLSEVLESISEHVQPALWVRDMERREEFCRLALAACKLVPLGETKKQAAERFESVSTLKRNKVLSKTAAAYHRMKEIRRQMKEKAAREAANVYGRE